LLLLLFFVILYYTRLVAHSTIIHINAESKSDTHEHANYTEPQ